jgi:uncharacterized protein
LNRLFNEFLMKIWHLPSINRALFALFCIAFVWLLGGGASAQQHSQGLVSVPDLTERVADTSLSLGAEARARLNARLVEIENTTGAQVAIIMVASTAPEDIAAFAFRAAAHHKIGRKGVGDGVLIVVAKEDRKLRIEVAKALEGALPDLRAKQIIQNQIGPAFKDGRFAEGLEAGVAQIGQLIAAERLAPPGSKPAASSGVDWTQLGIFLFAATFIAGQLLRGMFGRGFGSLLTGGLAGGVAWWITASMGLAVVAGGVAFVFSLLSALGSAFSGASSRRSRRGGWDVPIIFSGNGGSFGSGGGAGDWGGFSSGGGGDFGGGGASGDW